MCEIIVGYDEEIGFYENSGFEKADDAKSSFHHIFVDLRCWYGTF